jgi:serine/threonine protein kinase
MAELVGHESLLDAKILHRDVSIGNVMLTMAEDDGFLIDLDLAVKIDRKKASGAPSKTGTKVFMAIGALYGEDHNFMHDLELFFWVLFWICVHWNGPCRSRSKSKYDSWNYKATGELAEIKKGKVDEEDKFTKEVEREFTAQCKPIVPCIRELREVVFPGGKRWLREDRQLYSRMRSVLQRVAEELDITEQQSHGVSRVFLFQHLWFDASTSILLWYEYLCGI